MDDRERLDKIPEGMVEDYSLTKEQLLEVYRVSFDCIYRDDLDTKPKVMDYIEKNTSTKRVAILAGMYVGSRTHWR